MHILNLVVKSIMHQFDVACNKNGKHDTTDERTYKLMKLAGDIEMEELVTQTEATEQHDEDKDEGPHHNNDEGWINKQAHMSEDKIDDLEDSIQPICFLLTKVSNHLYMNCTVFANHFMHVMSFFLV
jgi:hypothetical protein